MTVDEELEQFADGLRRMKIEYDAYFNGGMPRPPTLLISRVERIIKKYGGGTVELSFRQRYRFSQLAQDYFTNKNVWRRKLKARDEGTVAERHHKPVATFEPFSVTWADPDQETEKVNRLREALVRARTTAGDSAPDFSPERFAEFIREKTRQFKESLECDRVRFTIALENGRVKLRAVRARENDE